MKTTNALCFTLAAVAALFAGSANGDETTNRLTLSPRFGLNISARFSGVQSLPLPKSAPRTTPQGQPYNYDNGYVLTDISGNAGGQTWYWGYDNSRPLSQGGQVSGNNILLSRSAGATMPTATADDNPQYGGELAYQFLVQTRHSFSYGLEVAVNYTHLSLSDNHALAANLNRLAYPFAFTPGTTPPQATPAAPYQGSFEGPGFTISDTPGSPLASTIPGGAAIFGSRQLDGDVLGFRLGPCFELPLSDRFSLTASAGLAVAIPFTSVSWNETVTVNGAAATRVSGSGTGNTALAGFYAGANLVWQFAEKWSAVAGAQFQDVGTYDHDYGGRSVKLDMRQSVFVTVGLGYSF
jgi:hypothetical protein